MKRCVLLCGTYTVVDLIILCQQNLVHDHMDHPVQNASTNFRSKILLGHPVQTCPSGSSSGAMVTMAVVSQNPSPPYICRQLYKNWTSRKIDSQRLFSREQDFHKTFSLTENEISGKTYFYTIHPCSTAPTLSAPLESKSQMCSSLCAPFFTLDLFKNLLYPIKLWRVGHLVQVVLPLMMNFQLMCQFCQIPTCPSRVWQPELA